MASKGLRKVGKLALNDREFFDELIRNPDVALTEYRIELGPRDRKQLKKAIADTRRGKGLNFRSLVRLVGNERAVLQRRRGRPAGVDVWDIDWCIKWLDVRWAASLRPPARGAKMSRRSDR